MPHEGSYSYSKKKGSTKGMTDKAMKKLKEAGMFKEGKKKSKKAKKKKKGNPHY